MIRGRTILIPIKGIGSRRSWTSRRKESLQQIRKGLLNIVGIKRKESGIDAREKDKGNVKGSENLKPLG